MGEFAAGL